MSDSRIFAAPRWQRQMARAPSRARPLLALLLSPIVSSPRRWTRAAVTALLLLGMATPVAAQQCENTCPGYPLWANDGVCDDAGPGSEYDVCAFGTDCADCGPRVMPPSQPPSPPTPPPPLSPPPTPPPMCECDVVHGAASLFDPCLKIEAGVRHCYPSAGGCPADMTDCISVYDCKNKMRNKKCDKKKNRGFCDLSSAKCTRKRGKCEKIRKKCQLSCGICSS